MSDEYLRRLERLIASGDVRSQTNYIQELLRIGYINDNAINLAVFLRDAATSVIIPIPWTGLGPNRARDDLFYIHNEIPTMSLPYLRTIIRSLINVRPRGAWRVKSKNESNVVGAIDVIMRLLFAAIGAALDALASAYIDPEESHDPYHQINFQLFDNYQRLVELFIRNTEYEVIQSILPKMNRIHHEIITRIHHEIITDQSFSPQTTPGVSEAPWPGAEHELTYRVLINGLERLGRTLSILVAPEFEDHDTAFFDTAIETFQSAVSVANLVIRGNNWPVIRDAISNDLVGWLFYRDPLKELVE